MSKGTGAKRDYPLFLNVAGRRIVVVGGGAVAQRKVAALIEAGAMVRVVSPTLTSRLAGWVARGTVTAVLRRYRRGDLGRAELAFAATDDPAVNRRVAREAADRRVWVNVADGSTPGDFVVPATLRRGTFLLAVASGVRRPALSKSVRDALQDPFGNAVALTLKNATASERTL